MELGEDEDENEALREVMVHNALHQRPPQIHRAHALENGNGDFQQNAPVLPPNEMGIIDGQRRIESPNIVPPQQRRQPVLPPNEIGIIDGQPPNIVPPQQRRQVADQREVPPNNGPIANNQNVQRRRGTRAGRARRYRIPPYVRRQHSNLASLLHEMANDRNEIGGNQRRNYNGGRGRGNGGDRESYNYGRGPENRRLD